MRSMKTSTCCASCRRTASRTFEAERFLAYRCRTTKGVSSKTCCVARAIDVSTAANVDTLPVVVQDFRPSAGFGSFSPSSMAAPRMRLGECPATWRLFFRRYFLFWRYFLFCFVWDRELVDAGASARRARRAVSARIQDARRPCRIQDTRHPAGPVERNVRVRATRDPSSRATLCRRVTIVCAPPAHSLASVVDAKWFPVFFSFGWYYWYTCCPYNRADSMERRR